MGERLDPTLADEASYRHWTSVIVRFGDLDLLGHVNNVRLAGWLEDGRVGLEMPIQPCTASYVGPVIVLVDLHIQYLAEVHLGDEVRVGTRTQRVGKTSATVGQAVFANGKCAVIAEAVEVVIDQEKRTPIPLPTAFRELFESHLGARA